MKVTLSASQGPSAPNTMMSLSQMCLPLGCCHVLVNPWVLSLQHDFSKPRTKHGSTTSPLNLAMFVPAF